MVGLINGVNYLTYTKICEGTFVILVTAKKQRENDLMCLRVGVCPDHKNYNSKYAGCSGSLKNLSHQPHLFHASITYLVCSTTPLNL